MEKIDFGDIGIGIGAEIVFKPNGMKFVVSSGNGTPGNGGNLIRYPDQKDSYLYSLLYITRRLMEDDFNRNTDVWEQWEFHGRTLRNLYEILEEIS